MLLLDTTIEGPQIPRLMTDAAQPLTKRPSFRWGLAGLVLAIGYADLARGGMTLAPIFLVVGYCILIPVAILT
jgi:hypothetical protein